MAGAVLRQLTLRACLDWPALRRSTTGLLNLREFGGTNQHKHQVSGHNLRMNPCAKLAIPYATGHSVFRAALQSNKVYPPRRSLCPITGIVARRINAIR